MALDECFWEIGKQFCLYKLEHIFSFYVHTNETGNQIEIGVFKVDDFSHEKIAYIIECFNAFLHFFDNNQTWEEFTYSKLFMAEINEGINYNKHTFTTKTNPSLNIARQNIKQISRIH